MRITRFLESSPLFALSVTYDEIFGRLRSRLLKERVEFLEALIVTGLFFEDREVQPTELAKTFQCSKSRISHALRRLERKGLVERRTATQDARAYYFSLTKEGRRIAPRLIKFFDSTQAQIEKVGLHHLTPKLLAFRKVSSLLSSS